MIPVPQYPEYLVNEQGIVLSTKSGRVLSQHTQSSGYKYYSFFIEGKNRNILVHRLLQHVFLDLPDLYNEEYEVDHKDENKLNNSLDNLQVLLKKDHVSKSISQRGYIEHCPKSKVCSCGNLKQPMANTCSTCYNTLRKKQDITVEDLEQAVHQHGWVKAQASFNMSDNGLRKRYKAISGKDPKTLKKLR